MSACDLPGFYILLVMALYEQFQSTFGIYHFNSLSFVNCEVSFIRYLLHIRNLSSVLLYQSHAQIFIRSIIFKHQFSFCSFEVIIIINMQTFATKTVLKRKNVKDKSIEKKDKSMHQTSTKQIQMKYVSLRMLSDSDVKYYQKESGLIKVLQEQNNLLRAQNVNLKHKNSEAIQQNKVLKQRLQQYCKTHQENQNNKNQTEAALNQLKQKIQELSDEDYTSTYDEIQQYDLKTQNQQIEKLKQKLKFLEDTLKHSDRIIIKLKDQNERIKNEYKEKMKLVKQKFGENCLKSKASTKHENAQIGKKSLHRRYSQKYFISSIQQKSEQGDE